MEAARESCRRIGPACVCGGGAAEIVRAAYRLQTDFSAVFAPSGSGGTEVGLATGLAVSINVSSGNAVQFPKVSRLADETVEFLGTPRVRESIIENFEEYIGSGYSLPTPEMAEAVSLLAQACSSRAKMSSSFTRAAHRHCMLMPDYFLKN